MKKDNGAVFAAGIAMFAVIFVFSKEFAAGVSKGLSVCADTVIPSLFAFMCAATLTGQGEMPVFIKYAVKPIMKLMKLPPDAFPGIFLGMLGGYPVGAKTVRELLSSGKISENQAERMMYFCINPGLGFSVNVVGNVLLNSKKSGLLIFFTTCISSLLIAVFSSIGQTDGETEIHGENKTPSIGQAVVGSVTSSAYAMLTVCGFVVLFSGIAEILKSLPLDEKAKTLLLCFFEVTGGCIRAAGNMPLPLISGVCAFGGVCVHLQVLSMCEVNKPKFFFMRLIHSALSVLVCILLLEAVPVELQTMEISAENLVINSFSVPATVSLLFLSSLMILELDNGRKL